MMLLISDFIGDSSLANDWMDALFDVDFEYFIRRAEECTSKESVQNYLFKVISFLQKTSISDVALHAEQDVLILEKICHAFYNNIQCQNDYQPLAHKILAFADFPYDDNELCITLGVLYLSTNFRIWACRKYLQEIMNESQETCAFPLDLTLFVEGNWHPTMVEVQNWFQNHYATPQLSKIYLHAFDLKILSYYTRQFGKQTAYDIMRDYIKKYDTFRFS